MAALLVAALLAHSSAQADTLADAARRESKRRAGAAKATPTFTETDLAQRHGPGDDAPPAEEPSSVPRAAPPGMPPGSHGEWASPESDPSQARKTRERYWRGRVSLAREQIKRAEQNVARLQEEVDGQVGLLVQSCTGRQTSRRTRISGLAEDLEAARASLAEARQAFVDLEEEARRSSVPPGWLRE